MSQRHSNYARRPDEEYNTPAWVAAVIALWLADQSVREVWEPAPGSGHFAGALRDCGCHVLETRENFLDSQFWWPSCEALVTNPPYGRRGELGEAFAYHALKIGAPIVALLLRVDFDSAKTRRRLFGECPFFAGKIVLLDRIDWFARPGKAGSSTNHAWFIWSRVHRGRPWISYGLKATLDENRSGKVGDADDGRACHRGSGRRVAAAARDIERDEG